MVSIPISLAMLAIRGTAPVPVPPPMPAVKNSKSTPLRVDFIVSLLSSAACSPLLGSAPAPKPLVSFSPIVILRVALDALSACLSVLTATNSTFLTLSAIILLTALFPPPPTPMTIMLTFEPTSLYSPIFSSSK